MAKILLVEDQRSTAELLLALLENQGYSITSVGTATEALSKMAEDRPDIVILDMVLPGMDGFACLKEMRRNPLWKDLPVIVTSALPMRDLEVLRGYSEVWILQKPFGSEIFRDTVQKALGEHKP
jgi:CheY-like chemotaxis protein